MGLTTAEEYTEAIRREAAYTEREAAFLYLAAVHSGAFVTRQYAAFSGVTQGGLVSQFINKGMTRRHFSAFPTRNATRVYQVCKPVYGILGEPDNRNRRPKQSDLQRLRLMSLDYVIANLGQCYLTSEADKLEYLGTLGAPLSVCPSRTYTASNLSNSVAPATRYFVEKYPISKRGTGASFAFLCENSVQTFESFLDRYLPLLGSIPEAEVVYVTSNPSLIKKVQAVFNAKVEKQTPAAVDCTTFESEFQEREALERKGFEAATTEELRRLRALKQRSYAHLYSTWRTEGLRGIEKGVGKTASRGSGRPQFSTYILTEQYRFL